MEVGRLCIVIVLVLGSVLSPLFVAALPVVSSASISQAFSLDQEDSPCGHEFQINAIPPLPSQDDTITVTYSAIWGYLPTPVHQSHEIVDRVIRLDAVYHRPEISFPVLASWGGQAGVGNLPTGEYRVDVYLTTVVDSITYPPELCGTKLFVVCEEVLETYLPVIPK